LPSELRIEAHTTDRLTTLTVSGELDLVSSPVLERELERAYGSDADLIALDLRGLEFMDSTGLHLLIRAQQRADQAGRRLALIQGREQVERVLDLTGVAGLVRIVASPGELLEGDRASDAT
jgi:anti-anti-sigma factor